MEESFDRNWLERIFRKNKLLKLFIEVLRIIFSMERKIPDSVTIQAPLLVKSSPRCSIREPFISISDGPRNASRTKKEMSFHLTTCSVLRTNLSQLKKPNDQRNAKKKINPTWNSSVPGLTKRLCCRINCKDSSFY